MSALRTAFTISITKMKTTAVGARPLALGFAQLDRYAVVPASVL
jgi:hypothetical protein